MSYVNSLLNYAEYSRMVAKKRIRISPLRKELDAMTKDRDWCKGRLLALETTFSHWFVIGKDQSQPCKTCGLAMMDTIHKDIHV